MSCYYPVTAFQLKDGSIVFQENKGEVLREFKLPCSSCDGCRMERSRQWAVRCTHEAKMHEENCFITLTYNDENCPQSLDYRDFQLFMKRLRKKYSNKKIRFFMCGEYGDTGGRAHFHACLFGIDFDDKVHLKTTRAGNKLYTSKTLENLWSDSKGNCYGFCTIGGVSFDSAGYIARYVLKKRQGIREDERYNVIDLETGMVVKKTEEFVKMSLKPGIGYDFYKKYTGDIFNNDCCVINGKEIKPPKYYMKKLDKDNNVRYKEIQEERERKGLKYRSENTEERLRVRERVKKGQIRLLQREL